MRNYIKVQRLTHGVLTSNVEDGKVTRTLDILTIKVEDDDIV